MKNIDAGIAVASTYGFTGYLVTTSNANGYFLLILTVFSAICTWVLVNKSE